MREKLAEALERLAQRIRAGARAAIEAAPFPRMLDLTPRYVESKHGLYLDVIEAALNERAEYVKNIALTGSYGVGKSSILSEVAKRHDKRVISISLSSLGFPDEEATVTKASSKTNRIQKEIVKQLLYSQDPVKMPGSRYRRVTRFRPGREIWFAALVALPVTVVFALTGWSRELVAVTGLPEASSLWMYAFVFLAVTFLVFAFRWIFHNRIQIERLSAGAATISLSARSATYFDEYLDEIVYFFEVVKYDIVIFEDIDRFDDAHIFETLRSLNSILNGARQLKNRKIRFIYAIKDSIFDELGKRAAKEERSAEDAPTGAKKGQEPTDAAEAELARANRTKFFDLVVPVVPFITHRSARDLIVDVLKDVPNEVSTGLIDMAARHLADMRLIMNIRNEFAVFKNRVIDPGALDLSQTKLFAMMLYKSTHLADFELIKLGKSKLDVLYRDTRLLVNAEIVRINTLLSRKRIELKALRPIAGREKQLGAVLSDYVNKVVGYTNYPVSSMSYAGTPVTDADFQTEPFWTRMATTDGSLQIAIRIPTHGLNIPITITRADIAMIVGDSLREDIWTSSERKRVEGEITTATADKEFLLRADMGDLAGRDDFSLERDDREPISFKGLVVEHLGSELAQELVFADYLDRNFTLYTSTFHDERVSANATNFILKNVDRNTSDFHFPLSKDDAEAVVRERGTQFLTQRAAYNVSILDYLLEFDRSAVGALLVELQKFGEEQKAFLLAYMESGSQQLALVRLLASNWPHVFVFLVTDLTLEDDMRWWLVNAALTSAVPGVGYEMNDEVRTVLERDFGQISVLVENDTAAATATEVARIAESGNVRFPALAALGPRVREAVVHNGRYVVNRENLLAALGDQSASLSLDSISASDSNVYRRVLEDLNSYAAVLNDDEYTVRSNTEFVQVLADVFDSDPAQIPFVANRAEANCRVEDIEELSSDVWGHLAAESRFEPSVDNLKNYIDQFGVDSNLAELLQTIGLVSDASGADEPTKLAVALGILLAHDALSSSGVRAKLAEDIGLEDHIPASSLSVEPGENVGWLLAKDLIADDASAFTLLEPADVAGRVFAITQSSDFTSFMSPTELPAQVVGSTVSSPDIPAEVKEAVFQRFEEFTLGSPVSELALLAGEVVALGEAISFDQVARIAQEGVGPELVVPLLRPHLANTGLADLLPVLNSLGGEYARLGERNGKHPKVSNDAANLALLQRLEAPDIDLVKSHSIEGNDLRAHMRK
jgi:hypothetical protein